MFGGGFKAPKCKTLLRLAMARIKLLRNKRDIQIKQMRKEIAQLLSSGQEPSARIRVEHIAREQNILAAYDIVELFCELIIVRLPIIESQKVCPMDLKEAVASLIFAAPRCADLPELLQIRGLFSSKYGKEFVAAAAELRPDCGVNRRIIEKLSVRAPSGEMKLKLLTEIAEEHNVNWDPADSEAQLLKQPEDLLDGPKKFFGSEAPVPEAESSARRPPEPSPYQQRVPSARAPATPTPPAPSPPPPQPTYPPSSQPSHPPASKTTYPPPGPPSQPAPQPGRPAPGPQARSAPSVARPRGAAPPSSSDSDDESPVPERQFIPFTGPAPKKGLAPAKGNDFRGHQQPPERRDSQDSNSASRRPDPTVENEKGHGYNDVTEAAAAAAQHADRAKAAARAAAELAKTHQSRSNSQQSRSNSHSFKSPATKLSSSEEETSSEEEDTATSQRTATMTKPSAPPRQPEDVASGPSRKTSGGGEGSLSRNSSESRDEGLFRSGSYQEEHANSFSRWKAPTGQPDVPSEPPPPPPPKMDSEPETFWRSGDEDWWQGNSLKPESRDSGEFSSMRGSDAFSRGDSDDPFTRLPKNTAAYAPTTPKLFSSTNSSSNLFNRSNSEERGGSRTFDEAPAYDSKSAFETPKFDDDDDAGDILPPYGKQSSISSDSPFKEYDLPRSYFRNESRSSGLSSRDSDTQRPTYESSTTSSKVTMQDYWNNSSYFRNENRDNTTTNSPETFDTLDREEKSRSGSFDMKDSRYDDVLSQDPDARDNFSGVPSPSSRGYQEEAPKGDRTEQSAPIPTKSRRTRNGSKGSSKLETAGGSGGSGGSMGSGGLPPPPGRRATFIDTKELSRSPDYYNAVKPDSSPGQSFENSPTFPPKTSLSFYNNSMPRGGGGASASLERKVSPGTGTLDRKTSPSSSSLDRKTSPSSSSLDRKYSPSGLDSPSLERQDSPSLHPNLPDYDDLTARFGALKERARR